MTRALKVLFIILAFFSNNQLSAQNRFGKVKCDSFLVMKDTSKALVYRKNKTSVFDKSEGKFRMKPTKDALLYIQEQDLLVQIGKEKMGFIYVQEGNRTTSFSNDNPDYSCANFSYPSSGLLDSIILFNGAYLNYKNGTVATNEMVKNFEVNATYSVQRLANGLLVIHNTRKPTMDFDFSTEQFIYIDGGIAQSGVYNPELRKWVVPPIYQSINLVKNNVIALKNDPFIQGVFDPTAGLNQTYHYYEINAGEAILKQENITENTEIDLAALLDVDSVENRFHGSNVITNQYVTYKKGKQGLVEFQLFYTEGYESMGWSNFAFNEIFSTQYDHILYDPSGGNIITLANDSVQPISFYRRTKNEETSEIAMDLIIRAERELVYGANSRQTYDQLILEEQVLVDGHLYYWPELIKTPGFEPPNELEKTVEFIDFQIRQPKTCGLQFFNDSLLHVIHYEWEKRDLFATPLESIEYPGEDSITFDEEGFAMASYPPDEPGFEKSGVLNMQSKNWCIAPRHEIIYKKKNGLLVESVIRDQYGTRQNSSFSLYNLNGDVLYDKLEENIRDLETNEMNAALFGEVAPVNYYEYPEKSIYRENYGYREGLYGFTGEYFAVLLNTGEWQIQKPVEGMIDINPYPITKPAEFVHYNPSYRYYFWMDQDSLYLEIGAGLYATARKNGKINVDIIETDDNEEWRIHIISGDDTLKHSSYLYDAKSKNYTTASFYVKEDLLFVNEPQQYDNITPNAYYLDGFYDEMSDINSFKNFDTETSYICQLTAGVWKKVTPYYASVEPIPFGYLVYTGDEEEITDPYNYIVEKEEGRYLILDTNFKAISYLDFYDFSAAQIHPFGVQLCMEHCFMLDNQGKIITSAEWDEFLIEDNQLKAVRLKEWDDDTWWEYDGEDFIEQVKFYPLPNQ
jgi:hypothetical protein